jgi:hypothetical protein
VQLAWEPVELEHIAAEEGIIVEVGIVEEVGGDHRCHFP